MRKRPTWSGLVGTIFFNPGLSAYDILIASTNKAYNLNDSAPIQNKKAYLIHTNTISFIYRFFFSPE